MLFYGLDAVGNVTGPHMAAVVRRKIEAGELTWESLLCVQGTQDWVPAHVYQDLIDPELRAARERAEEDRRLRSMMLASEAHAAEAKKAGRESAARGAFLAAFVFTVAGIFFPAIWWPFCCLVCGLVAMLNGAPGRGILCLLLGVLSWPVLVVQFIPLP